MLCDSNSLSHFSSPGKPNLDSANSIPLWSRTSVGIPWALLAWGLTGVQSRKGSSVVTVMDQILSSLWAYRLPISLHPLQLSHLLPRVCCSFLILYMLTRAILKAQVIRKSGQRGLRDFSEDCVSCPHPKCQIPKMRYTACSHKLGMLKATFIISFLS